MRGKSKVEKMPRGVYGKPLQENLRACSWHRSVLVKEGWEALGAMETFWESLSGTFSKLPPAQMFYGSFLPEFAQAQAYMVLFVWGPILPVTCPSVLPTAAQEKAPFCPRP